MEKQVSRRNFLKTSVTTGVMLTAGGILINSRNMSYAGELQSVQLEKPQTSTGNDLLKILEKRRSTRAFSSDPLPVAVLSSLLWAAFGINRPDGKRTAPSAMNCQDIDIYVILPNGLYLYDPKANQLKLLLAEDLRGLAGTQAYVKEAPVNLIYVSDYAKLGSKIPDAVKPLYGSTSLIDLLSGAHAGYISQNVYIYCASEGLATVVRAFIDIPALSKVMKLRPEQKIILGQSVGYPKKTS